MDTRYVVVYVMAANTEEAVSISLALVEEKLVACANTINEVQSVFWWNGKMDDADEQLIIMKTTAKLLGAVIERVKALHSYDVPEIIAMPIVGGNPDYLKWIDASVKQ